MNFRNLFTDRRVPFFHGNMSASESVGAHDRAPVTSNPVVIPLHSEDIAPQKLLDLGAATMILQPHLGSLNAGNWLADMRRSEPRYAKRVFTPPKWVKHCGKIKYPASEIERVIKELNMLESGISLVN